MNNRIVMYTTAKLCDENKTGGYKRFLELYYGFREREIETYLYTDDSPEKIGQLGPNTYSTNFQSTSNNILLPARLKSLFKQYKIIKQIKKSRYDSLIIFGVPTAISFCIFGSSKLDLFIRQDLISYRFIIIKDRIKNKYIQNIYLWLMKMCESICIIRSRKILIQCEYDKYQLYKRHPFLRKVLNKKVTVQINNVNPSWIIDNSADTQSKIKSDKDTHNVNKLVIGFIGDFSNDRKGQRIFVDAIKGLIDYGVDIEAIMVGDGKQLANFEKECSNYPEIQFTGSIENPMGIIKQCDLMVVPSLADSCPNTVMEALYNEVPVIGARSGGIPEILNNEDFLFEPNSLSLQNKIHHYLNGDNLIKLKEQQYIRKNELEFDWSSVMLDHLQLGNK